MSNIGTFILLLIGMQCLVELFAGFYYADLIKRDAEKADAEQTNVEQADAEQAWAWKNKNMTADDPLIEGNRKKIILFSPVVFALGISVISF